MTEETKVCSRCKIEKNISLFTRENRSKDGLCCYCRECQSVKQRERYIKNNDEMRRKAREIYHKNKTKINERCRKRRAENVVEKRRKELEYERKYRREYRDKILLKQRRYRLENKEKVNKYFRNRYKIIKIKIEHNLRQRIRIAVLSQSCEKLYKSIDLLGCSVDECRKWLEGMFLPGMTFGITMDMVRVSGILIISSLAPVST